MDSDGLRECPHCFKLYAMRESLQQHLRRGCSAQNYLQELRERSHGEPGSSNVHDHSALLISRGGPSDALQASVPLPQDFADDDCSPYPNSTFLELAILVHDLNLPEKDTNALLRFLRHAEPSHLKTLPLTKGSLLKVLDSSPSGYVTIPYVVPPARHEIQQPEQHRELDESDVSPLRGGIDLRMGELRRQPPQVDDLHSASAANEGSFWRQSLAFFSGSRPSEEEGSDEVMKVLNENFPVFRPCDLNWNGSKPRIFEVYRPPRDEEMEAEKVSLSCSMAPVADITRSLMELAFLSRGTYDDCVGEDEMLERMSFHVDIPEPVSGRTEDLEDLHLHPIDVQQILVHGRYTCAWPLTSTKVLEHPSSGLSMDVTGPEGTTQTFFRHLFYNTFDGCVVLIKCFFLRLVQFDESSLDDSSFFFSTRARFKKIVRLRRFQVDGHDHLLRPCHWENGDLEKDMLVEDFARLRPSEVFISLHEGDEHPLAFSSAVEDAPDLRRWFSYMCTVRMMSGGRKIVSTSSIINTDGWKKSIAMSTKGGVLSSDFTLSLLTRMELAKKHFTSTLFHADDAIGDDEYLLHQAVASQMVMLQFGCSMEVAERDLWVVHFPLCVVADNMQQRRYVGCMHQHCPFCKALELHLPENRDRARRSLGREMYEDEMCLHERTLEDCVRAAGAGTAAERTAAELEGFNVRWSQTSVLAATDFANLGMKPRDILPCFLHVLDLGISKRAIQCLISTVHRFCGAESPRILRKIDASLRALSKEDPFFRSLPASNKVLDFKCHGGEINTVVAVMPFVLEEILAKDRLPGLNAVVCLFQALGEVKSLLSLPTRNKNGRALLRSSLQVLMKEMEALQAMDLFDPTIKTHLLQHVMLLEDYFFSAVLMTTEVSEMKHSDARYAAGTHTQNKGSMNHLLRTSLSRMSSFPESAMSSRVSPLTRNAFLRRVTHQWCKLRLWSKEPNRLMHSGSSSRACKVGASSLVRQECIRGRQHRVRLFEGESLLRFLLEEWNVRLEREIFRRIFGATNVVLKKKLWPGRKDPINRGRFCVVRTGDGDVCGVFEGYAEADEREDEDRFPRGALIVRWFHQPNMRENLWVLSERVDLLEVRAEEDLMRIQPALFMQTGDGQWTRNLYYAADRFRFSALKRHVEITAESRRKEAEERELRVRVPYEEAIRKVRSCMATSAERWASQPEDRWAIILLDTETASLKRGNILELGFKFLYDDVCWSEIIRINTSAMCERATEHHQIQESTINSARSFPDVFLEFWARVDAGVCQADASALVIVAHNGKGFDFKSLAADMKKHGELEWPDCVYFADSLPLLRSWFKKDDVVTNLHGQRATVGRHNMEELRATFLGDRSRQKHRATEDVLDMEKVLKVAAREKGVHLQRELVKAAIEDRRKTQTVQQRAQRVNLHSR